MYLLWYFPRSIGYSESASRAIFPTYGGRTKQSTMDQRRAATTCQRIATRRGAAWGLQTKRFCQKYVTLMYINPSVIYTGGICKI